MTTTLQPQDAVINLGWINLGFQDIGTGEIPIVLLHGGGPGANSPSNFVLNIPAFAADNRVLAVDLPGFGKSDTHTMTEPWTTVNARAVKDLMDALGVEKANLVGNSLGGGTSIAFALDYPDRVNKMVLMGTGGGGPGLFTLHPSEGMKALQAAYQDPTFERFRAFFDVMLYDGSKVPDEVLRQRIASVTPAQAAAWGTAAAAPHRILGPDLGNVKAETLIIHGRNDRVTPMEGGLQLLAGIPNSELHIFNQCGHWVQYEQAERFNSMVLDFFSRAVGS